MSKQRASYLELVQRCDKSFPYEEVAKDEYYSLYLPSDPTPHGYLLPTTVSKMPWTSSFHISHTHPKSVTVLDISKGKDTAKAINAAFQEVVDICIERNLFHVLDKKHSEPFAILGANFTESVYIERFASSLFGITACGACLVAYTLPSPGTGGGMNLWIPRRAAHLYSFPGMLDITVAGGIKAGMSPMSTLLAEADEEASLPAELMRERARGTGAITCMSVTGSDWPGEKGLVLPDVLYTYEIELPNAITPRPRDDEVEEFQCMPVEEVQDRLRRREFKPDAAIVLIRFLIQRGIITSDNEPDYVDIISHLHRQLPFRIKPDRQERVE